jgi:uncharacterized protein (DUF1330 family)
MAYELLVAMQVADSERYATYREEMRPLLEKAQAGFRFDAGISQVLTPENQPAYNRIFVLAFPNKAAKDSFFADPAYQEIRARHFVPSVSAFVILAEYDNPPD